MTQFQVRLYWAIRRDVTPFTWIIRAGAFGHIMAQHFIPNARVPAAGWQRHSLQRHHSWPEVLKNYPWYNGGATVRVKHIPMTDPCNERYIYLHEWLIFLLIFILDIKQTTVITAPFLHFVSEGTKDQFDSKAFPCNLRSNHSPSHRWHDETSVFGLAFLFFPKDHWTLPWKDCLVLKMTPVLNSFRILRVGRLHKKIWPFYNISLTWGLSWNEGSHFPYFSPPLCWENRCCLTVAS